MPVKSSLDRLDIARCENLIHFNTWVLQAQYCPGKFLLVGGFPNVRYHCRITFFASTAYLCGINSLWILVRRPSRSLAIF
jgi:hypothetical protein